MPLPISPYEVIDPKDRWVPSKKLKQKDLQEVLPPLVRKIREEVSEWRKKDYPNISNTSKALIKWWFFKEHENFKYYFAQRESVETTIYLYEVVGIRDKDELYNKFNSYPELTLKHFNEHWLRLVIKMATGSGKTKVMSLLLLWSYFNKIYEENSEFSSNFLIIAPNIIVLDRLKLDFDNLSIYRNDPCIPEDGYENQNWKIDFFSKAEVHIQKQVNVKKKIGNIFLTNIQQIYGSREKEPSLEDDDTTEYFFGKSVKGKLESDIDLLKIIKQIDDVIIMNDEAHHINDEQQAWYKTIEGIHNNLGQRNLKLIMQLDYTATPKHKDSSIFVQTICDYPLTEAIHQNIVKNIEVPDPKSRDKLQDYPSTKFSEKWKDYIDLGYQEWKKSYNFHQKTKKKATLFIMTDDTKNCDDVSRFLENNYDDLKGQILTIHTKNNGDLYEKSSDLKSSKSKEDLKKLRENANTVDNYDNPYKVIVSVLMLKEGWDVNNVTTIVGLRPYEKPKILPEQTLGRGLRKMYRDSNLKERLTVVGTPNFMEFASELQKEGVTIREIEMGEDADNPFYITSEVKENEEEVNKLDIEFPNLVEKIFKNEEKISEIDPSKFKFKIVEYKNIQKIKKEKIIWEYSVSKEISRESEFEKTYALDSYNILAALVKEIMFVLKIQKGLGFEVICDKTKTFIENYLFGQKVEFDSEITKANLCSLETRKTIIETMSNEIKKVIIDERSETIISKIFKFSEDKSKRIKNFEKAIYFEPKKSVYTKHFFDSKFEEEVNIYIDGMPDIISCIKNMGYITIPYLDSNGIWRNYIPDFFVKVTDSEYCIIETKGAELINDPIKKNALEKKLEDINKVQNKIKFSSLYVLYDDFNKLDNKPSTFKKFFEIFKKTL